MNKSILFLSQLIFTICHNFSHRRYGFRNRLFKLRNLNPKQFQKWQLALLSDQKPSNKETHRQAEIAKKINR